VGAGINIEDPALLLTSDPNLISLRVRPSSSSSSSSEGSSSRGEVFSPSVDTSVEPPPPPATDCTNYIGQRSMIFMKMVERGQMGTLLTFFSLRILQRHIRSR